jgi:hypothetical protein
VGYYSQPSSAGGREWEVAVCTVQMRNPEKETVENSACESVDAPVGLFRGSTVSRVVGSVGTISKGKGVGERTTRRSGLALGLPYADLEWQQRRARK